jgi:DNA-binding CsgD family transcriptional regulator
MELIEREELLALLQSEFKKVAGGEGHCLFISGEPGIGKTALVKAFCRQQEDSLIYQGACDALFTPRPLAPLYDILWQVNKERWAAGPVTEERSALFAHFFQELSIKNKKTLIVFEDIHWADEGTLDFIKFFARRIYQLPCLFILTYRDDEIHSRHPLRTVIGQLPPDSFTKIPLHSLSKAAVARMATEKGYNGDDVYAISGGNPFYVNEILASYSPGVPENIKDSILSVYERQEEGTKHAWQLCSVVPEGLEIERFAKIKSSWNEAMDHCFAMNVIMVQQDRVVFKHELYRRTIEESLSPFKRIALNKLILELFLESFEKKGEIERIVHYAKNANENEVVFKYAPVAARQAACTGAHIESSKLFLTAIEYASGRGTDDLVEFYEAYAYECYLTNQIKEAIIYEGKALQTWKKNKQTERISNSLRFLSRLWWLESNIKQAELFAREAIEILDDRPASAAKAMAYSNMSQLKMLCDQDMESLAWGEKAIAIAEEVNDQEALSHALNNVGAVKMNMAISRQEGIELLQQSLEIALKNSFHEHAARAYSNLGSNAVKLKDYEMAKKILDAGIQYGEERDLDSWVLNMLSLKACVSLETGDWNKAYSIADNLLQNEDKPRAFTLSALLVVAKINFRTGKGEAISFLQRAKTVAFKTMELQKIIPLLIALLEYEWLTGNSLIEKEELDNVLGRIDQSIYVAENSELAFWLFKTRNQRLLLPEMYAGYEVTGLANVRKAAATWHKAGCAYAEAFALYEGNEADKKNALTIFQQLGASAICEKIKMEMRSGGIKKIPRGLRESTKMNPARLTNRELDILQLLQKAVQNKEIAQTLFISPKTVDHHISSILFKLEVNSRVKAVAEATRLGILK